jgi:hypothetical protein
VLWVDVDSQRRDASVAEEQVTNARVPTAEVVAGAVLAIGERAAVGAVGGIDVDCQRSAIPIAASLRTAPMEGFCGSTAAAD